MSEYVHPERLVSTDWLADHLDDPAVRVIEVDEDTSAYRDGHIPNALHWHWQDDLHARPRRDFIDQDGLSDLLQRAGVDEDTTVVFYGDKNNWFAAYAYWLARYLGFDRVKLLDGGRKKWDLEIRPWVVASPMVLRSDIKLTGPVRSDLRVFRDEVLARLDQATFVDVRTSEEFRGKIVAPAHLPQEQAQVPGHIPGARNIPWFRAANHDGSFRSAEELEELYHSEGVTPDRPTITYCRIGERSAHTWFVLHELLGYEQVANYDGSWTEYGSLVGVPIEVDT